MSRIGVHVGTGSRNGYGLVCDAKPALVFSTGEGGAVVEAVAKSDGHTYGVYRSIKYYNNHPEGFGLNDPASTKEEMYAVAEMFYPLLKEDWLLNPAHAYAVINESGANDTSVIKNYVWYEEHMMDLAEPDGFRLCLSNLFSGTPDDGSVRGNEPNGGIEVWKGEYGPLLKRGYDGGHIYGRHVYGFNDLVPLTSNTDRAFREIDWLRSQGVYIGVALTECGLHGGEYQPSSDIVIQQMTLFDEAMKPYRDMIVGVAWWTYGPWDGAGGHVNLESMSGDIARYLEENQSPKWVPIDYIPPKPPREPNTIRHEIHLLPQDATQQERHDLDDYLAPKNTAFTHSHDVVDAVMFHSLPNGLIVVWDAHRWDFDTEEYFSWLGVQYQERLFSEISDESPPPTDDFAYEVWPVDLTPFVTQHWANNPVYYGQFCDADGLCLPGHGGVDLRAPTSARILAVAPGKAVRVHRLAGTHNFGKHVYIEHADGELTGYAHLQNIVSSLGEGDHVEAGWIIGYADNTGNSFGSHLHFLRKRPGETYIDEHGSWPYDLFDPTPLLEPLAPHLFEDQPPEPPPPGNVDLAKYMAIEQALGPLYEVQTEIGNDVTWGPGPQQRHQTHAEGSTFFHTKGGDGEAKHAEWEQLKYDINSIYRGIDTSPSEDQSQYYELMDELGVPWSVWCPRFMSVGQIFHRYPYVTFYLKESCEVVSESRQASLLKLEQVYETMTFFTGITLTNVIKLLWTDLDLNPIERYYYAEGYGLVGWEGRNRRAAISEIHSPGSRPNNIREVIDCL